MSMFGYFFLMFLCMFWCQDLDFIVISVYCVGIMQEFSCPSLPRQLRAYHRVHYKAALSSQHPLHRHAERREEKAGIKEDVIERTVSDRCKAASQCSGDWWVTTGLQVTTARGRRSAAAECLWHHETEEDWVVSLDRWVRYTTACDKGKQQSRRRHAGVQIESIKGV